jgi:hypothetical protein
MGPQHMALIYLISGNEIQVSPVVEKMIHSKPPESCHLLKQYSSFHLIGLS